MKRKLLSQIVREWRSNLWLVIELLVVSVVMWYITDYLATKVITLGTPMGIETDNCFAFETGRVPKESAEYDTADSTYVTWAESNRKLVERLRVDPDIEGVAIVSNFAMPYSYNSRSGLYTCYEPVDTFNISCNIRAVSPDYMKIFRVKGCNGETSEELAEMLRSDNILATRTALSYTNRILRDTTLFGPENFPRYYSEQYYSDKNELIGKQFISNNQNDSIPHRLGAIITPIKRVEYELPYGVVYEFFDESNDDDMLVASIIVRVKPGTSDGFVEKILSKNSTLYRVGNTYIKAISKLDDRRVSVDADKSEQVRNHIVVLVFLMVSIFLGLLGTFWFRTQQRTSEIAIRMVNGATSGMMFNRLISEGLLLLIIATPVAIAIDWTIACYELNSWVLYGDFNEPVRFIVTVTVSLLLLALMIIAGIWFPARNCMKIKPAEALKDE